MKIVTVIPLTKGAFKENLTYFTSKEIENGDVVSVTLRNKKILGLVISNSDLDMAKGDIKDMDFNLKKIIDVKEHSIWGVEFWESAFALNKYFIGMVNDTVASLIPNIFREKYDKIAKFPRQENVLKNSPNLKVEKLLFQAPIQDRISYYKTMIRSCFAEKKSVFIVLPSPSDIESFEKDLSKGIENFTFIMHGGITDKKILTRLEQILSSTHPVLIIGTTPFLSIPRKDIEVIVLEHESSPVYKMMTKPYLDLRIFAEIYAKKINAKFILGDTLLRTESILRQENDDFNEVYPLSYRINSPPNISVSLRPEKFSVFTDETINAIQKNIENKKNVFIFSSRKGLATITICRDCSQTINCPNCMTPVVLYLSRDGTKRIFSCNRCKKTIPSETLCKSCGSWNLIPLGVGLDTVYEEIKKNFPKVKVFKIDKENAKTKTGAEKIIKEYEESSGAILIGTEMAFFYLKNKVSFSIVPSLDSLWSIPNFRMGEKIAQIILSIIEKTEKEIIIQTKNKEDGLILALTSGNLLSFIREELSDRKNLSYPPYKRFIKVIHLGNKEEMHNAKDILEKIFKEYQPEIFSGFVAKDKDLYSTNMLIRIETKDWSLSEISKGVKIDDNLFEKLSQLPSIFKIEVDPEDLL